MLREYLAYIVDNKDPFRKGRYKVYIPELMGQLQSSTGIWVDDGINTSGTPYRPLEVGEMVYVRFRKDDYNSGYICRIANVAEFVKSVTEGQYLDWTILFHDRNTKSLIAYHKPSNTLYMLYNYDEDLSDYKVKLLFHEGNKVTISAKSNDNNSSINISDSSISFSGSTPVNFDVPQLVINGNITLNGDFNMTGNVEVDGNIHATGTIIDEAGNTNHHTHT